MTQVPPPASTTPVTTSTPLQLAPAPAPAPPPVPVVLPANILASATSVLKQAQNAAHALLAVASAVVVAVEAAVEALHQFNVDTSGADWRIVAAAGGILTASKAVDSASWTSLLSNFTGGNNGPAAPTSP